MKKNPTAGKRPEERTNPVWRATLTDPWANGATGVAWRRRGGRWLWGGRIHGIVAVFWIDRPETDLVLHSHVDRRAGVAGRPHRSIHAFRQAIDNAGGLDTFRQNRERSTLYNRLHRVRNLFDL